MARRHRYSGFGMECTMGQKRKKHRINSHLIIHERENERSEQASERVSNASEQANRQASGPVLQYVFLVVLAHSGMAWNDIRLSTRIMTNESQYLCRYLLRNY